MGSIAQKRLFGWEEIEGLGELARLHLVLKALPDEKLLRALGKDRGRRGRDDYPVRGMWNSVVAAVVFQHPSVESLRRELARNGQLRWVCELEAVPPSWVYTRFLRKLMEHAPLMDEMFEGLIDTLKELLPDFGVHLAHDGKAICSHARKRAKTEKPDGRRDLDGDWGAKTRREKKEDGTLLEEVTRWFGYKLHLVVDSVYELLVARVVTKASAGEAPVAHQLVEHLESRHAGLLGRCETWTSDKGNDDGKMHVRLWEDHQVRAVIPVREMWKDKETRLVSGQRHVAYDERGTVYCHEPKTGEAHRMAYGGFEADRLCQKYRCPARQYGTTCAGIGECPLGGGVRVSLDEDRRIFTPLARSSKGWQKAYNRRTAVERVNSRLDVSFGFERHFIRGKRKMQWRVDLALVVMLAMAVGRIKEKQADKLRSLIQAA